MAKFEYAPAPESRAVVSIRPSYGLFIGGEFVESKDGSVFDSTNSPPMGPEPYDERTARDSGAVPARNWPWCLLSASVDRGVVGTGIAAGICRCEGR